MAGFFVDPTHRFPRSLCLDLGGYRPIDRRNAGIGKRSSYARLPQAESARRRTLLFFRASVFLRAMNPRYIWMCVSCAGLIGVLLLSGCCRDTTGAYGVLEERRLTRTEANPWPQDPILGTRSNEIFFVRAAEDHNRLLLGTRSGKIWITDPDGAVQDTVSWPGDRFDVLRSGPSLSPTNPSTLLLSANPPPDSTTRTKDFYLYDLSSEETTPVTSVAEDGRAVFGSFLPDGNEIVYVYRPPEGSAELRITDIADSGESTRLASLERSRLSESPYALFPDGTRLVYADGSRLVVVDLSSGDRTQLYSAPSASLRSPRVSPGGSHVLFRSRGSDDVESLLRLDISTGAQAVVDRTENVPSGTSATRRFFSAQFAGSARRIVYGLYTDTTDTRTDTRAPSRIYGRDLRSGSGSVELGTGLARTDLDLTASPFTDHQITVSSDGDRILFVGRRTYSYCAPTTF